MTDLDKMKSTFTDLGVDFNEKTSLFEHDEEVTTTSYDGEAKWDVCLYLENGIGYYRFECEFYFLGGNYVNHGLWE